MFSPTFTTLGPSVAECQLSVLHGLRPDVTRLVPASFHRYEVTDVAAKKCPSRGAASGRVRGVSVIKHSPEELIIVKLSARTSVVLYKPFDCFHSNFSSRITVGTGNR